MNETLTYEYAGQRFRFEIIETVPGYSDFFLGKCIDGKNSCIGEEAWLDPNGFQFDGKRRVSAKKIVQGATCSACSDHVPYGYAVWGGQLRDKLPHGARYYMR